MSVPSTLAIRTMYNNILEARKLSSSSHVYQSYFIDATPRKDGNYENAAGPEMVKVCCLRQMDARPTVHDVVYRRYVFWSALCCISFRLELAILEWQIRSIMQHLSCQKMHFRVAISCTCFRSARRTSRVRPPSTAWRTSPAAGRVPGSSRGNAQHQPNYPKSSLSLRGLLCVTSGLSMKFFDSLLLLPCFAQVGMFHRYPRSRTYQFSIL